MTNREPAPAPDRDDEPASKAAAPTKPESESIVEPDDALPELTLEELPGPLREACSQAGWSSLMPVQARAMPYLLARRDLMIQSRTGSGKTGAFLLPIFDRIDTKLRACQALILVPTRELARQVARDAELLGEASGVLSIAVYGGVGYGAQMQAFSEGAQLVIGTPGRILDHLLRRSLTLDDVKVLVLDEADRMLSMGFYPDMKQVQRYLNRRDLNAYLFSATFPPHVLRLAGEFLNRPEMLSLSRDHVHVTDTEHVYCVVPPMEKDRALVRIIEMENPTSAIIFCNTKTYVHYVSVVLKRFGYDADELSADISQAEREKVLGRLREGTLRFLVATDVAARGIDIPQLSHVIQYDVPQDPEGYVHRAGRTGRAGAAGEAITLITSLTEETEIEMIGRRWEIDFVKRPAPTAEDVQAVVSERVTALLEARLRSRDSLHAERMRRFVPLGRSLAESEDESAIIAMLLDDYYQESLHAPPPQPEETESRARPSPSRQRSGAPPTGNIPGGRGRPRRRR